MDNVKKFIMMLLNIGALKINIHTHFVWASGWNSPVYCDLRKTITDFANREFCKHLLVNLCNQHFNKWMSRDSGVVIAGVATAGIPHANNLANFFHMPFVYVRPQPKGHGLGQQIEGILERGTKVIVIEELVSTGKSCLQVVDVLRAHGCEVLGVCSLFSYDFKVAKDAFDAAGVEFHAFLTYDALLKAAHEQNIIKGNEKKVLEEWRQNPAEWRKGVTTV